MMNWMMNGGMALLGGMVLFMTLWILVLVMLIWALIRWLSGRSAKHAMTPPGGLSALEILEQRYAHGEIDHTTFEQMRERLQASRQTNSASWSVPR
jgi:putative membrane protein